MATSQSLPDEELRRINEVWDRERKLVTTHVTTRILKLAQSDILYTSWSKSGALMYIMINKTKAVLKLQPRYDPSQEVALMNLVGANVPVPHVITHGLVEPVSGTRDLEYGYIVTRFIDNCTSLDQFDGTPTLGFYHELEKYVAAIRSHTIEYTGPSSVSQYLLNDPYFVEALGDNARTNRCYKGFKDFMNSRLFGIAYTLPIEDEPLLVLSHCDLVNRNVLITNDGEHVAAIIDWEFVGYYPDFYEYFKYLHEFKEDDEENLNGKELDHGTYNFRSSWLSMFRTDNVAVMNDIEALVHDRHLEVYNNANDA